MEENKLDASEFVFKDNICSHVFQTILSKITTCYKKMIASNVSIQIYDENKIRDILLLDYLKNPEVKRALNLENFLFDREISENSSTGRVDIRIMPINPFISDVAYYILECKRLDNHARRGVSGLNYKYIDNGIQRFTTGFYSSYYKLNAMVGFVIEPMDIHSNIEDINYLLENNFKHINTTELLTKINFINNFDFHYCSNHMTVKNKELKLYHLMFDFAN
ncbi:MAG: hypothetical protein R6U95_06325 [Bacteroidales bacterium]